MTIPSRLLAIICVVAALSSCIKISPERAAAIKRVLVVNEVEPKLTRHHAGLTAFTNQSDKPISVSELDSALESAIRQVLREKLPNAEIIFDHSHSTSMKPTFFKGVDFKQVIPLANKARADAAFVVVPVRQAPGTMPEYMDAEGCGLWQRGLERTASSYVNTMACGWLLDAQTAKRIAQGFASEKGVIVNIPWRNHWSDYSDNERGEIIRALAKSMGDKIAADFTSAGLK